MITAQFGSGRPAANLKCLVIDEASGQKMLARSGRNIGEAIVWMMMS